MKGVKGYRVTIQRQGRYGECYIDLIEEGDDYSGGSISFKWQCNLQEEDQSWYGCSYTVRGEKVETLQTAVKVMGKIDFSRYYTKPAQFIQQLEVLKIREVASHKGTGRYYTKETYPIGATWQAIIEGASLQRLFNLTAISAEAAKREAAKYAGNMIAKGYTGDYMNWLQSEQVVIRIESEEQFPQHEFNTIDLEKTEFAQV